MTVAITAGSNCTVNSSLNSHNITIPENGTAPLLTFESASSSNNEGSGSDAAYNVIIKLLKHDGSGDDWFLGRVGSFSYTIAGTGSILPRKVHQLILFCLQILEQIKQLP